MKADSIFPVLILLARPAAGKSELIRFIRETKTDERIRRFHIGHVEEIDDFPMLWTWFEEDALLEEMGKSRLHTTSDGYFKHSYFWDLLIRRINLEYEKRIRDESRPGRQTTTLIEFSRGKKSGGYRGAFEHLSEKIARKASVLYINVSFEESLRKNRVRFNPEKPHSILEHGLPDEKMHALYRECDWKNISAANPGYGRTGFVRIGSCTVPYGVFENEDDITTAAGPPLADRLEKVLAGLWELFRKDSQKGPGPVTPQ